MDETIWFETFEVQQAQAATKAPPSASTPSHHNDQQHQQEAVSEQSTAGVAVLDVKVVDADVLPQSQKAEQTENDVQNEVQNEVQPPPNFHDTKDDGNAEKEEEEDDDEDDDGNCSVIIHGSDSEACGSTWYCRRQSQADLGVSETEVEQLTNESDVYGDEDDDDEDYDDDDATHPAVGCGLFALYDRRRPAQGNNDAHGRGSGKGDKEDDGKGSAHRHGAHKRVHVEIMKDLAKIGDSVRTSAKKGQSMITQMTDWLSCLLGNGKEEEDAGFDIKFEKIKHLKFIGSGAQGCVYLGTYKHEEVAVKKMKELSMTVKEESLLRTLNHDNIIRLIGVCKTAPVYAVVMEYCPQSLYDVLQRRHLPPAGVVNWASQVAHGMQYLHGKGIVHRDLKSPNILLGQDKATLKISDFGCCREYRHGKSVTMSFSGTAAWMAPEIIRSESCTEHVDVWSYGVVLWELLTREVPYKGVDAHAIVWGVGNQQLHLPVPASTPDGLRLVLQQCWDQTPKNRPSFTMILKMLHVLATTDAQFAAMSDSDFEQTQREWREEITAKFAAMKQMEEQRQVLSADLVRQRTEELHHAQEIRQLYEQRLDEVHRILHQLKLKRRREKRRRGRHSRSASRDFRRPRKSPQHQHSHSRAPSDAAVSVETLQWYLEHAAEMSGHDDSLSQA
ncbi:TKL/MLK/LZK protein kinase [Salpingoeca rosetta]|uniref:TKL/MLK/LZK protein kinase n=1 Tax=Salpingoeca rosetta (strain ATCC 50818 / BSB-021) TaxID=946362 RepID=F2U7Z5_SALR5|nr:TKL/MLK/LZK protein kinase [Salpingoeca rosetta]EGD72900.1 TKL/MLK/LZK protein kinase [Salpingoeca rosetta]|eukprot:XP_004994722.1 TKL/MLK/LZK protein kinase [Salpingoeca rosetta]